MSAITDLLEDLEFVRWVKYPDNELATFWKSWMHANPDRIEDVKLAREIILGLQFPSASPKEGTKEQILERLLKENPPKIKAGQNPVFIIEKNWWQRAYLFSKVAAILIVVLGLSALYSSFYLEEPELENQFRVNWTVKETSEGERLSFRLPDQSIVWLNSGSSLTFPESFDSTARLVKLKGEGFFEVSENKNKPFQVLSKELLTTALGTSFNINAKNPEKVKVALVTGKVSITHPFDTLSYFLVPGQALEYQNQSNKIEIRKFNLDVTQGWRFGKLIYEQASLDEVLKSLRSWYGVKIYVVGEPNRPWHFNGEFENQTLENVLKSISNIEDFSYMIDNKTVTIEFNK